MYCSGFNSAFGEERPALFPLIPAGLCHPCPGATAHTTSCSSTRTAPEHNTRPWGTQASQDPEEVERESGDYLNRLGDRRRGRRRRRGTPERVGGQEVREEEEERDN